MKSMTPHHDPEGKEDVEVAEEGGDVEEKDDADGAPRSPESKRYHAMLHLCKFVSDPAPI